MGEILNTVGDIAIGSVKTIAADRATKFLVENLKKGLVRTGMISPEVADNEHLDMALSVLAPAIILWGSMYQKEFLGNQIGADNVKRIRELAKISIRTQGVKVMKPLFQIGFPLIKGFLTEGFSSKQLPEAREQEVKVVQEERSPTPDDPTHFEVDVEEG